MGRGDKNSAEEIRRRRDKIREILVTHPHITTEELADRLDVSNRTIERDLEKMRETDYEPTNIDRYVMRLRKKMQQMEQEYRNVAMAPAAEVGTSNKLGALNGLTRLTKTEVRVLQRLGALPEEPIRIEQQTDNTLKEAIEEYREELADEDEVGEE